MSRYSVSKKILQNFSMILLSVAVSTALAWGQHKNEGSHEAAHAPAQHSAPSHSTASHSEPSHNTSSHSTPSHNTTGSHPSSTTSHSATPSHGATANRPNSAGRGTAAKTTNPAGRPGTSTAGHTGSAGRPGASAGHANTTPNRAPPGRTVSLKGGGSANIRPNGSIRSINRNGMNISRGVNGRRTVVTTRNGATIVSHGRSGYVQRSYVSRGGRTFVSRTYVSGGVVRVGVYQSYGWGGRSYYGYYPGYFYNPGFYGWGYQPWGVSVAWGIGAWGWGGAPWYGYYGGWFNPYPVYASPAFWLTDYLLAADLQAAYSARSEAHADEMAADAQASGAEGGGGGGGDQGGGDAAPAQQSSGGQVTLTPEVKQAIAEEVKAQLAAQQQQAQTSGATAGAAPAATNASVQTPPPALDPAQRTFVVDSDVTVVNNGQECALTSGDVVTRLTDTPDTDNNVNASVSAAKKGDCASGSTVAVKVDDLQEMYNHFQEQLTNGMGELAKKQGTNGMPKAPDTSGKASDVPPPQPDSTAAQTLQDQQKQADQTESQVKQEAAGSAGGQ